MNKTLRFVAIPSALVSLGTSVMAAVPENVNKELSNLQADALTVAGIVLAAIVAVYAFKFIRRGL